MTTIEGLTAENILSGIAAQRDEGSLCDVKLRVDGKCIPAHRNVLAAASLYFHAMFTTDFKERKQDIVDLKDISYSGLQTVIQGIYSLKLNLTEENLCDTLSAANLLQVDAIIKECKKFMLKVLTSDTCFHYLNVADTYNIQSVVETVDKYILEHFVAVSKTTDFTEISKEELCKYLCSDEINCELDEANVFEAARRWIEADGSRLEHVSEVMKHVRFKLISGEKLGQISDVGFVENNAECRKLIRDALVYHSNLYRQPFVYNDQNKARGINMMLNIDGGHEDQAMIGPPRRWANSSPESKIYLVTKDRPSNLTKSIKPSFVIDSVLGMRVSNFLFLFAVDNESIATVAMRYNVSTNQWMNLKPIPRQATVGSVCSRHGEYVYIIGGMFITKTSAAKYDERRMSNMVYQYCITSDSWVRLKDFPVAHAYSAAVSSYPCLYVSGGIKDGTSSLYNFHAYNTTGKLYIVKQPMNKARMGHVMEMLDSKLYVIGGTNGAGFEKSIEVFNSQSGQWTIVQNMELPVAHCSSIVSTMNGEGVINIIGGIIKNQNKFTAKADIHVFTGSRLFSPDFNMKSQARHVSVIMKVPNHS